MFILIFFYLIFFFFARYTDKWSPSFSRSTEPVGTRQLVPLNSSSRIQQLLGQFGIDSANLSLDLSRELRGQQYYGLVHLLLSIVLSETLSTNAPSPLEDPQCAA